MIKCPDAATRIASEIEEAALKAFRPLEDKALRSRKTGVTSDDLSQAMVPFLREAEELLGDRQRLENAFIVLKLVRVLARYSYGDLGSGGSGYGERPSDSLVDSLLMTLASHIKITDPRLNWEQLLGDLQREAQFLSEFGINGYCLRTIELLSAWESGEAKPGVGLCRQSWTRRQVK